MTFNYRNIKYIFAITVILFTSQANAATLTFDNGLLSGISGVEALGTTWDVSFNVGSFDAVYGLGSLPFVSHVDTVTATASLFAALDLPNAGISPRDILGCTSASTSACFILTPYDQTATRVLTTLIVWQNVEPLIYMIASDSDYPKDINIGNATYTTWKESTVPAPAAIWLFGSGLIGLIGLARRKKA